MKREDIGNKKVKFNNNSRKRRRSRRRVKVRVRVRRESFMMSLRAWESNQVYVQYRKRRRREIRRHPIESVHEEDIGRV